MFVTNMLNLHRIVKLILFRKKLYVLRKKTIDFQKTTRNRMPTGLKVCYGKNPF